MLRTTRTQPNKANLQSKNRVIYTCNACWEFGLLLTPTKYHLFPKHPIFCWKRFWCLASGPTERRSSETNFFSPKVVLGKLVSFLSIILTSVYLCNRETEIKDSCGDNFKTVLRETRRSLKSAPPTPSTFILQSCGQVLMEAFQIGMSGGVNNWPKEKTKHL